MSAGDFGGNAWCRARALEWMCTIFIFLSAGACSSNANGEDAANGRGGGGSGGGSASSTSSDDPPDCGFTPLSVTRLPGKNVSQFRIANGSVYYGDDSGVFRVPLGNRTNGGQLQVSTGGGLHLTDTYLVTFELDTYPAGNLRLIPLGGGDALTQPTQNRSVIGDWRYPGPTQTLFGLDGSSPIAYLRHDLATGAEQRITTSLTPTGLVDTDLVQGPTALFVDVSGYEPTDPSLLYRIDKNGGEPVAMTTGLPVRFRLEGADTSYVYLEIDGRTGAEDYGPALWQVPVDGSAPAARIPIEIYNTITSSLFLTDAGTFLHLYDAYEAHGHATYRVGPSSADAAAPPAVFGVLGCRLDWIWAAGGSTYGLVENDDYSAWMFELPG